MLAARGHQPTDKLLATVKTHNDRLIAAAPCTSSLAHSICITAAGDCYVSQSSRLLACLTACRQLCRSPFPPSHTVWPYNIHAMDHLLKDSLCKHTPSTQHLTVPLFCTQTHKAVLQRSPRFKKALHKPTPRQLTDHITSCQLSTLVSIYTILSQPECKPEAMCCTEAVPPQP